MPARAPPDARPLDGAVPFRGEQQAGIATAGPGPAALRGARRRDRRTAPQLVDLLKAVDRGRRADDARRRGGAGRGRRRRPLRASRRTPARRSTCRASGLTITIGFGPLALRRPVRAGRPPARRRCATCPAFRGDDLDPARSGGDLVHPGLRQRPAGGGARGPQPRADRLRRRRRPLEPARASAAPRRPAAARSRPATCSASRTAPNNLKAEDADGLAEHVWVAPGRRAGRGRLDGRRLLPRRAPDPDAHRGLGPHHAPGAGAGHRPRQGGRARRWAAGASSTSPTSRPRAPTASRAIPVTAHVRLAHHEQPRRHPHPAPRLQLHRRHRRRRATSTPGCSSSPSCATPRGSSCRCSGRSPRADGAQRVHRAHRLGRLRLPARRPTGEYWGQALFT